MNCATVLDYWANYQPNREAVICASRRITYHTLRFRVQKLVKGFVKLGVRKGDKVALLMDNSVEMLEINFALSTIGACMVPLNFRLRAEDIHFFARHSDAIGLIYHGFLEESIASLAVSDLGLRWICRVGQGSRDCLLYEDLMSHDDAVLSLDVSGDMDDVQAIMYTSGSTGEPKGAMLTNGNWIWNAVGFNLILGAEALKVGVVAIPMFHTAGLHAIVFPVLFGGGTVIILPLRHGFNARDLAMAIAKESVTYTYMAPEMWTMLAQLPDSQAYDLSSMQRCLSAGGVLPVKTHDTLLSSYGLDVAKCYGLTEAGPLVTITTPAMQAINADTVGQPVSFCDVRLVDDEDRDVPVGEVGECIIRGPNVSQGYFKSPDVTRAYNKEGWAHTGDLLRMDENHLYYFVSRKKDMIKSGGENIFATEVEEVLNRHPKIAESAVIGVPHPKWGEGIKALIVVVGNDVLTADDVWEYCRVSMAGYKKPQFIEFVDAIPKLVTGKVDKVSLRRRYGSVY
ncbi:MAG: o-succinylbenzoate--CoA ligase [Sulfobacillus acidophilus]|uniref:O-succinylbenzoate--CoA ligase n=1 Tax=Sulfobacillus acidophilus TaxID=53633 RepID=A0A2T2WLU5_9FIRM|nr:MAG: o-succinylbenzoate--CoA ligase [Sulfobacillus acidophilus]